MASPRAYVITATTDASGDATVYSPPVSGRVHAVIYTKVDYATGVDFVITAEDSGVTIWSETDVDATKTVRPSETVNDSAGVVISGSHDHIAVASERIKIVISNGGATKTGIFRVIIDD